MSGGTLATGVEGFATLLGAAVLISIFAERVRIPAAVLLVAAGAVAGTLWHVRPPFAFSPGLLFVFLPPLIFEAAWNIDLRQLRPTAARIALLAFPGTLVTAFAIAFVLAALGVLPFGAALLLGAMLGATDPVAVIPIFRWVGVPDEVRTVVEGESLANDGVSVVLYGVALVLAAGGTVVWWTEAAHGILAIAGGIAVGAGCAVVVGWIMRATEASEYEVTITVALAYVAYLAADRYQLSGIFATAAGAVVLRSLQHRRDSMLRNAENADHFWNAGAYIANAIVFLATGLEIDAPRAVNEPLLIGAALVVTIGTRALLALAVMRETRERVVVLLAGMRGALPLALALAIPASLPQRPAIVDAVFATVLVTLVLQGAPLAPLARRLYGGQSRIGGPDPSS